MMWYPNWVSTTPLVAPGASDQPALSNAGTWTPFSWLGELAMREIFEWKDPEIIARGTFPVKDVPDQPESGEDQ